MAEIVLHMGWPKTGTTALQHALMDAADALAARGVFVPPNRWDPAAPPDDGRNAALRAFVRGRAHAMLSAALFGISPLQRRRGLVDEGEVAGAVENATAAFAASGCGTMAVSHEMMFWNAGALARRGVPAAWRAHGLRGVAYARRYDEYYLSSYRQGVKAMKSRPVGLAEHVGPRIRDLHERSGGAAARLRTFRDLGIEVDLRSYDEVGRGLVDDAFRAMGVPADVVRHAAHSDANPSFSEAETLFVVELHRRREGMRPKRLARAVNRMRKLNRTGDLALDLPDVTLMDHATRVALVDLYNREMADCAPLLRRPIPPVPRPAPSERRVAETLTDAEWSRAVASLPDPVAELIGV